jgi:hypothetical protein
MVHSWLVQTAEVVAFCVANRADGGNGALIVLLRPPSSCALNPHWRTCRGRTLRARVRPLHGGGAREETNPTYLFVMRYGMLG